MSRIVAIDYTNWRGVRGVRIIEPQRIHFGATEFHPEEQWLLEAWDISKKALRTFALCDIHKMGRGQEALQMMQRAAQAELASKRSMPVQPLCGLLHGEGGADDPGGCVLPCGHAGPHEFVDPAGVAWQWHTDFAADAQGDAHGESEPGTVYWRKPAA